MSPTQSGAYPARKRIRRHTPRGTSNGTAGAAIDRTAAHRASPVAAVYHFVHRRFVWLLIGSYALAAFWPRPGLAIREVVFGRVGLSHESSPISLPMLMLAFLLFNAGLDVKTARLQHILRRPRALLCGLAGNFMVPIAFIFLAAQLLQLWHNFHEAQFIILGLALVAAMPIAGSSTAWSQNANGDTTLSLGLVLLSTLLSPLLTPLVFDLVKRMASGEYAAAIQRLEAGGTSYFLLACVLLPSLLGIFVHFCVGSQRIEKAKPAIKLVNSFNLLLLNYSNAAISLPQILKYPDWDWLTIVIAITGLLCVAAFIAGWLVARLLGANLPQRISLMFGLGMNNNGTALVMASLMIGQYPRALVPIISYNLIQHLVAGVADFLIQRRYAAYVE